MYHEWATASTSHESDSPAYRPALPRILNILPTQIVYRKISQDGSRELDGHLSLPRHSSTLTFTPIKRSSVVNVSPSSVLRVDLEQQINSGQGENKCLVMVRACCRVFQFLM